MGPPRGLQSDISSASAPEEASGTIRKTVLVKLERWRNFRLFCTAVAAASVLSARSVLSVERSPLPSPSESRAREGAASIFETGDAGSRRDTGENPLSSSVFVSGVGNSGSTSPSVARERKGPSSPASNHPRKELVSLPAVSLLRKGSEAAGPQDSTSSYLAGRAVDGSPPQELEAAASPSGNQESQGTSGTSPYYKLQQLSVEELEAFCEKSGSSTDRTFEEEDLNITCSLENCDTSGEEHTQAKSAAMEEVCRQPSVEAALDLDPATSEEIRRHAKIRMQQVFSEAIKGNTVLVIGLPASLPSIAELATQVVVIEMDPEACATFLTKRSGVCTMRRSVQLLCMKPNDMSPPKRAEATLKAADEIISRIFLDTPLDVVYISSEYPVAAALKLLDKLHLGTTFIIHHRISYAALQTLSLFYRQDLSVYPDALDDGLSSSASFLLLRRGFNPPVSSDTWREYLTAPWRLRRSDGFLTRLSTTLSSVLELAKAADTTAAEKRLKYYARTMRQFWVFASDEERAPLQHILDTIHTLLQRPNPSVEVLEDLFRMAADRLAQSVGRSSRQKYYLLRLEEQISNTDSSMRPFLQALFWDMVVATRRIEAAPRQRTSFKRLLINVQAALQKNPAELPRLLHMLRTAIETFTDVKDTQAVLRKTQERCFSPIGT